MIEINLLPEHLRKKQLPKFNLPFLNLKNLNIKNIALIVSLLFIASQLTLQLLIGINSLILKHCEKRLLNIQPQKAKIDELKAQVDMMKAMENLFSRFSAQRFEVAPNLNSISDMLVDGLWLYELSLSNELCEIKGSSVSLSAQELAQIGRFLNALKADAQMRKAFPRLELVWVQRRKAGAVEVVDFLISSKAQGKQ